MFSVLLVDPDSESCDTVLPLRFQERLHLKHDIPIGRGLVGYAAQSKEAVWFLTLAKMRATILLNRKRGRSWRCR